MSIMTNTENVTAAKREGYAEAISDMLRVIEHQQSGARGRFVMHSLSLAQLEQVHDFVCTIAKE